MHAQIVFTVSIDVHGKFVQGIINWNRILCGHLSTAQVLLKESDYLFSTR